MEESKNCAAENSSQRLGTEQFLKDACFGSIGSRKKACLLLVALFALLWAVFPLPRMVAAVFHPHEMARSLEFETRPLRDGAGNGTSQSESAPAAEQSAAKNSSLTSPKIVAANSFSTTKIDLPAGETAFGIAYAEAPGGGTARIFWRQDGGTAAQQSILPLSPTKAGDEECFKSFSLLMEGKTASELGAVVTGAEGGGLISVLRISALNFPGSSLAGRLWPCLALVILGAALILIWQDRNADAASGGREGRNAQKISLLFCVHGALLAAAELLQIRIVFGAISPLGSVLRTLLLQIAVPSLGCAAFAILARLSIRSVLRCSAASLILAIPFIALSTGASSSSQMTMNIGAASGMGLRFTALLLGMESFLPFVFRERPRLSAAFFSAAELLVLACPSVALIYWGVFGQIFAAPAIEAIWQTNPHEALRFASAFVPHILALITAATALCTVLFKANLARVKRVASENFSLKAPLIRPAAVIFVLFLAGTIRGSADTPVIQDFADTAGYFQRIAARTTPENFKSVRISPVEFIASESKDPAGAVKRPRTHLVVIGESAGRDHHGLYGYERKTTPWMDEMASRNGLLVFQNAYAGNKYTYHSLEMALTEADQYDRRKFEDSLTLMEALKAAGFTVTWLSNQERDFNRGMPFGLMADSCDVKVWTDRPAESFDGDLPGLLKKHVDPSTDNVVFIHMNGSHLVYGDRTPPEAKKFSSPESDPSSREAYDDSILYTDAVLRRIFEYASANLNLASFAYFSDHGEEPGVPRDTFLWTMARIPFVLWFSDEYRSAHPERILRLQSRRGEWWSNDLFFDLALSLYDVSCDRAEAVKDLSSEDWAMRPEEMTTENGRHYLVCDPLAERRQ